MSQHNLNKKVLDAIKWIAGILNNNNISYRLGGGTATFLYGSGRAVNDIDISLPGKYFSIIIPLVKEYIVAGPKHYKNNKWDCITLSLNYEGIEIDLTDADTLLMSRKDSNDWIKNREVYKKYSDVIVNIEGVDVRLMDPRVLLEYKKELDGDHQESDRRFLEQYINSNK